MFDYQKAWMLLEVVHKAATAGPAYTWLIDLAAAELMKMKQQPAEHAGTTQETEHGQS